MKNKNINKPKSGAAVGSSALLGLNIGDIVNIRNYSVKLNPDGSLVKVRHSRAQTTRWLNTSRPAFRHKFISEVSLESPVGECPPCGGYRYRVEPARNFNGGVSRSRRIVPASLRSDGKCNLDHNLVSPNGHKVSHNRQNYENGSPCAKPQTFLKAGGCWLHRFVRRLFHGILFFFTPVYDLKYNERHIKVYGMTLREKIAQQLKKKASNQQ
ncbi:MAG: hypothetical protein ABIP80_02275 [Ferruginibacter sp.]